MCAGYGFVAVRVCVLPWHVCVLMWSITACVCAGYGLLQHVFVHLWSITARGCAIKLLYIRYRSKATSSLLHRPRSPLDCSIL